MRVGILPRAESQNPSSVYTTIPFQEQRMRTQIQLLAVAVCLAMLASAIDHVQHIVGQLEADHHRQNF